MKITPEEIRQYTFNRTFRGYDKEAVDQFLMALSQEWQKENDETINLQKQLELTEKELNRLKEVESIMLRTIKEGDENARKLLETTEIKAAEIIAETTKNGDEYYTKRKTEGDEYWAKAEKKGDEIIDQAELEKEKLLNEANETIDNLKLAAKEELEASEREYNSLDIAKQQLLYDLNSLLGNTTDRLSNIHTKYAPETFNAKKIALEGIAKANIENKPSNAKLLATAKVEKNVKLAAKAKTEIGKSAKTKVAKKVIPVPMKAKSLEEIESEDDGLPTVQKILALTEEPTLPNTETKIENENKSFFDTI